MKDRYFILKDRTNRARVIIYATEYYANCCGINTLDVAWGIAIRSSQDDNNYTLGKRIAKARAIRAIKDRKPCFVSRQEAVKNVWALKFSDFQKLMRLTGGLTADFQKGDRGLYADLDDFTEDINYHE